MADANSVARRYPGFGVELKTVIVCVLLIPTLFLMGCASSPEDGGDNMTVNETPEKRIRQSVIAGSWYPGSQEELSGMLDGFLGNAKKEELGEVKAVISPHAGYIYSGQVAAFGFKQVEGRDYRRVIILAPTHHYPLNGASVPNYTHYETPLGEVRVSSLAWELREESRLVSSIPGAHSEEHSAEIEIPFLQKTLTDFEIIPIIVGRMSMEDIDEFSDLLITHLDEKTLIVASTDLSHYHTYDEALSLDRTCVDSITALDMENAVKCEMCGYYPVLITMMVAEKLNWTPRLLKYANSGDVVGDRSRVVGYTAIAFYVEGPGGNPHSELSEEQERYLLKLARDTMELYVREGRRLQPETDDPKLMEDKGVFVTLEKNGQLRGCIGHIQPVQPLYLDVRDNAINAAVHDPRFRPVKADELDEIEVEVSVLTIPELIQADSPGGYLEEIQAGVDGIIVDYKGRGATYLPQVWEQIPDKEEFLSNLCEKASLPSDCWREKDAKIYRYRVIAFKESEFE
jgi:AmmeMemoRadiSam system protein B/AmmeMemoRadiSam system protein A